jgi:hypothetical protein
MHTDRYQQGGFQRLRGTWNGEVVFMEAGFQSER